MSTEQALRDAQQRTKRARTALKRAEQELAEALRAELMADATNLRATLLPKGRS